MPLTGGRHLKGRRVEVGARVRREPDRLASVAGHHRAVFACRVEDDDLVVRVRQDSVLYLPFHRERLAGARLARYEPHGACERLAVAQHQVRRLLVLAVVPSAVLGELLSGEGHLDGHLSGRHHAGHLHVVVPEREDGVHALALAVIEGVGLDRVLTRGRDDLVDLIVQFLPGRRVGVDESV